MLGCVPVRQQLPHCPGGCVNPQQSWKLWKCSKFKTFYHLWEQQNKWRGCALGFWSDVLHPIPESGLLGVQTLWPGLGDPRNAGHSHSQQAFSEENLSTMAPPTLMDLSPKLALFSAGASEATGRGSGAGPILHSSGVTGLTGGSSPQQLLSVPTAALTASAMASTFWGSRVSKSLLCLGQPRPF